MGIQKRISSCLKYCGISQRFFLQEAKCEHYRAQNRRALQDVLFMYKSIYDLIEIDVLVIELQISLRQPLEAECVGSVSYTHLDVYKRQT